MKRYPDHVEGFVGPPSEALRFAPTDSHEYYQLRCSCGSKMFQVSLSAEPMAIAHCMECRRSIKVYDLSQYPSASVSPHRSELKFVDQVHPSLGDNYPVFVMYEYPESEDDVDYDNNDISWCQVFIGSSTENLIKVLDDETS